MFCHLERNTALPMTCRRLVRYVAQVFELFVYAVSTEPPLCNTTYLTPPALADANSRPRDRIRDYFADILRPCTQRAIPRWLTRPRRYGTAYLWSFDVASVCSASGWDIPRELRVATGLLTKACSCYYTWSPILSSNGISLASLCESYCVPAARTFMYSPYITVFCCD